MKTIIFTRPEKIEPNNSDTRYQREIDTRSALWTCGQRDVRCRLAEKSSSFVGRKHTANIPVEQSFCYNEWSQHTNPGLQGISDSVPYTDLQITSIQASFPVDRHRSFLFIFAFSAEDEFKRRRRSHYYFFDAAS